MTHEDRELFAREWPQLARRLRALLVTKGVGPAAQDDAVQETGVRLIRDWDHIDKEKPLWPLASTIAMNLVRDEARKGREKELIGELPEWAASLDVEQQVLARLEIARTARALNGLSDRHREALLGELMDAPGPRHNEPSAKMVRLRARRRLMLILDTISIAMIGLTGRIRRQGDWLQPAAAAVVTAAVVASLGGGAAATFDGPETYRGVIHQQTARTISGGDGNSPSAPAYFAAAETTGGTYLESGANSPDKTTSPSGPSSTTIFEVDGVDDTPEQTTVQVLDTKVKTGEEGSPAPVCVSGSSIAPAPAACPSPDPRKR